jgi:hypothetical protein
MFLSRRSESQQTVLTYIFVVWDAGLVVSQTRQDESPVSESDSKCRQWHVLHQPHGYLAAVQQIDRGDGKGPSAQHGRAPDSYQIQLRTFHDELIWYRNGRGCVLSPCASTRFSVLMGRATPWHFFIFFRLRRSRTWLSLEYFYWALAQDGVEPPPAEVRSYSPATRAPCPAAHTWHSTSSRTHYYCQCPR